MVCERKEKYNIDTENLHSFFVSYSRLIDNYDKIINLSTLLSILSGHFDDSMYDYETVLACTDYVIEELYNEVLKEQELMKISRAIYTDILQRQTP